MEAPYCQEGARFEALNEGVLVAALKSTVYIFFSISIFPRVRCLGPTHTGVVENLPKHIELGVVLRLAFTVGGHCTSCSLFFPKKFNMFINIVTTTFLFQNKTRKALSQINHQVIHPPLKI